MSEEIQSRNFWKCFLTLTTRDNLVAIRQRAKIQAGRPQLETVAEALIDFAYEQMNDKEVREVILNYQRKCLDAEVA